MMFPIKFPAALLFFALSMSASPVLSSQHMAQRGDDWYPTFDYPQPGAYLCAGRNVDVVWYVASIVPPLPVAAAMVHAVTKRDLLLYLFCFVRRETSNIPKSLQKTDGTLVLFDANGSGPTWSQFDPSFVVVFWGCFLITSLVLFSPGSSSVDARTIHNHGPASLPW
jgi:hypothetical protein